MSIAASFAFLHLKMGACILLDYVSYGQDEMSTFWQRLSLIQQGSWMQGVLKVESFLVLIDSRSP